MSIAIKTFAPLGAKIVGADVDTLLHDEGIPALVNDALEDNGVLVFAELGFDDAQQVAFARRLGEVVAKRGRNAVGRGGAFPEIYHVGFGEDLNNALYVKGAFNWHLDGTTEGVPSKASLLSARAVAASGGDTQFVSTYAAYERLSPDERERLADLRVLHSAAAASRKIDPDPPPGIVERLRNAPSHVQPLVWTHRSGRKSLVLGATASHVIGMPEADGAALLADLLGRATEPSLVFTHRWSAGDLVIWDNRGTLHRATPYTEDSGRRMHRVTLLGDEPIQ